MMNRWQLETMRSGVAQELKAATEKLSALYADVNSNMEARASQKAAVEDVKERLEGINAQVKAMDDEAANKLKNEQPAKTGADGRIVSKAALYRSAVRGESAPEEHYKALADNATTGGDKFLPKTVASQILSEPTVKNPLRGISTITNIPNLEIPKIAFSLDDDEFIADGESAKEIAATGSAVSFGRNTTYDIKAVEGDDTFSAILGALADLEEDYRDNAKVVMRFADYLAILQKLANSSTTLYGVPPEQVIFCDLAVIPVVGDFSYSHYNYDIGMQYERDKNVKSGMESFVLTAWFDHQIKMKAAFRRLGFPAPAQPLMETVETTIEMPAPV